MLRSGGELPLFVPWVRFLPQLTLARLSLLAHCEAVCVHALVERSLCCDAVGDAEEDNDFFQVKLVALLIGARTLVGARQAFDKD